MFNAIIFVCFFFFIEGKMSRYVLTYRNLRCCFIDNLCVRTRDEFTVVLYCGTMKSFE